MSSPAPLKQRLKERDIVVAARRLRRVDCACSPSRPAFSTLYVSGAAIAYTRLGRPDIGLVSMSEVAEQVAMIHDRVGADLVVDADTGYGNALNVQRTVAPVRKRAGAAGDPSWRDQTFPQALRSTSPTRA